MSGRHEALDGFRFARQALLAFDPGETTGVVKVVITAGKPMLIDALVLPEKDLFSQMADPDFCHWAVYPAWIVERFYLYPWMKPGFSDLIAPQVIGAIRVASIRCNSVIHWSFASEAKTRITDDAIRSIGWWEHLPSRHCRDAARHALYHLVKQASHTTKGK